MDARLALILYIALLLGTVAPIAAGWLALLPHEREPFARPGEAPVKKPRDGFAIFLLANISLSLLVPLPGVERELRSIVAKAIPETAAQAMMLIFIWLGFVPGLAAAYSAARANPLRVPLLVGGVLALALWLSGPWLLGQIAANP